MARLEVLAGDDAGQSFLLTEGEIFLGRSPDNGIYLTDSRVSRRHAILVCRGSHVTIEDLNSTNGIILRGERIPPRTPCDLADGDEIRILSTRLVLHAKEPRQHQITKGFTPPTPEKTPALGALSLMRAVGPLRVNVVADDTELSETVVSLDASKDMASVHENESTDKGLQDALRRLQAMCQVNVALGAITDWDRLLQRFIACIFDLFPAAEHALLMLRSGNGDEFVPVMVKQRQDMQGQQSEVVISRTIMNVVVQHKRSILSFDTPNDSRSKENNSLDILARRGKMCAPLLVGDEILGLIQVDTSTGKAFMMEDLQLLNGISSQAAVVIKNRHLIEASQAKSYFLANMSHELRTPLNAIIGYSEMLMEDAEAQSETHADLQKIYSAGKHQLALVNNILDLSKIEAGKMTLVPETFEVVQLINEVTSTIEPLVGKNANTLEFHVTDDAGTMYADMTKIRQILLNLLSNAVKFTDEGRIRLEAARNNIDGRERLTFRVIDSGIGMTTEQMAKLFQPFAQATEVTSHQYGGTGLGLAISQRYCQMMEGDLTVESTFGQGSTFTFWLPAEVSTSVFALEAT